jgi:hypothetical protein
LTRANEIKCGSSYLLLMALLLFAPLNVNALLCSSFVAAGDRIVAESVVFALLTKWGKREKPLVRD